MKRFTSLFLAVGSILLATLACIDPPDPTPDISRPDSIPTDIIKMTPEMDLYPPTLHSDEWEQPVPLPYPINSAGGEDSPFITPNVVKLRYSVTGDKLPDLPLVSGRFGTFRWYSMIQHNGNFRAVPYLRFYVSPFEDFQKLTDDQGRILMRHGQIDRGFDDIPHLDVTQPCCPCKDLLDDGLPHGSLR